MDSVFVLQHLHVLPGGEEDAKVIVVYRSHDAAKAAVSRLSLQPGFRDFPNIVSPEGLGQSEGFYIDEYQLDQDNWAEGYETL